MRCRRVKLRLQKCSANTRMVRGRLRDLRTGRTSGGAKGSVEVKMRPSRPTSAQSEVEAQEAPKSAFRGGCPSRSSVGENGTGFSELQEPGPPLGSVEVRTLPLLSTTTQRSAVGHEASVICTEPPESASCHDAAGPSGSVEVRTLPVRFPATQSSEETQSTPSRSPDPPGVPTWRQAEAPPVGSVETKIRPSRATATQSVGVLQETPGDRAGSPIASPASCRRAGRWKSAPGRPPRLSRPDRRRRVEDTPIADAPGGRLGNDERVLAAHCDAEGFGGT